MSLKTERQLLAAVVRLLPIIEGANDRQGSEQTGAYASTELRSAIEELQKAVKACGDAIA